MDVSQLKQYLPPQFESRQQKDARYIHAVICVYLLTIIQPEYKHITYQEFVDDFEKYIDLTNFRDNPCLVYQKGKHQGELKIPNKTTFSNTWVPRYNVNGLIEEFKEKVSRHILTTSMRDVMPILANIIEKENTSFDMFQKLEEEIYSDNLTPAIKKPYPMKAAQESKSSAVTNIKNSFEMMQDYSTITQQQNAAGEVYQPNHDRIIDKYHNLENEWEED